MKMSDVHKKGDAKDTEETETIKQTHKTAGDPKVLFKKLYNKALELGIDPKDFHKLESLEELKKTKPSVILKCMKVMLILISVSFASVMFVYLAEWPISNTGLYRMWFNYHNLDAERETCVIDPFDHLNEVFRMPTECDFCQGLGEVDRISNISQADFEKKYAYSGLPVIITDAAHNWTALKVFSFHFFRQIYAPDSPALQNTESDCQFFGYKSEFTSLGEVFEMDEERALLKNGSKPWYIGWSNCDFSVSSILRQHYNMPYFLPKAAESSRLDWIFMGSPGHGAGIHIDDVRLPSWQAQIAGTKKWTLEPPQECYFQCPYSLEVVVHPGEVIVLDTNRWYHGTLNIGNDISITIGSEFD